MTQPLLTLSNVRKSFGGVRALLDASLQLYSGEVTALIGENGAGKSTLVKILTGVHRPEGGAISLNGSPLTITSPQDATRAGISVIHQESVVFDDLSVAENIFAGEPLRRFGLLDHRRMKTEAARLLGELECNIDPSTRVGDLSIGHKHFVQIARALAHDSRIVIMDEPTAALSHHEAEDLLRIVRRLKSAGRAILYISHKFEEILSIADRYAVFRDGAAVGHGLLAETNLDALVQLMVGRPIDQIFPKLPAEIGAEVLNVEQLGRPGEFADVSFRLRKGEILGLYGLVGAGRSEVMQSLFGLSPPQTGRIQVEQRDVQIKSPNAAINLKIAYVPEDRQRQGGIITRAIGDNIALPSVNHWARFGFSNRARERATAHEWISKLQIKCQGPEQELQALSGGNQQKVVLARWLQTAPHILILDEPTKGIDVGSKAAVHRLISECAQQGLAIIMVSSELPEVMGMADRILVMRRGRVRAVFERAEATPEAILRAATDA
jgi:rhamnose transport system ATP-binding protein